MRSHSLVLTSALALAGCLPSNIFDITPGKSMDSESSGDGSSGSGSSSSGSSSSSSSSDGESSSTSDGSASGSGTTDTTSSTGVGSTGASSTTEEPPEEFPLCGNGQIDGLEECDEASALCHGCKRDRFVFVSSIGRTPAGIGGLAGADSLCKQFANKGGLANWQSYTAWLSDSTTDAKDRIYPGRGRYLRVDMVPVADSWEQLFSGQLLKPIEIDEYGKTVHASVWTGTFPDGTAAPGVDHCADWTMSDLGKKGAYDGSSTVANAWWTLTFFPNPDPEINPVGCAGERHLYCFEGK